MFQNNPNKSNFDVYDHSIGVEFYSNVLYNVSRHSEFPIHKLIGHRGQAPPEVQRLAVNEMELKMFLTRYPSIFTVTRHNCVKLVKSIADCRSSTDRNKSKAECSNDSDIAVQFYLNVIKKKLSNSIDTSISLKSLIGCRGQAPPAVQKCAKNVDELSVLVRDHPEKFTMLPGDLVTLTKLSSVVNCKNKCQNHVLKLEYSDNDSALAVEYYSKILNTTGPNYPLLSLIGHRGQAPSEVKKVALTPSDLKSFLSKFPYKFNINGNHVTLQSATSTSDSHIVKSNVEPGGEMVEPHPNYYKGNLNVDKKHKMVVAPCNFSKGKFISKVDAEEIEVVSPCDSPSAKGNAKSGGKIVASLNDYTKIKSNLEPGGKLVAPPCDYPKKISNIEPGDKFVSPSYDYPTNINNVEPGGKFVAPSYNYPTKVSSAEPGGKCVASLYDYPKAKSNLECGVKAMEVERLEGSFDTIKKKCDPDAAVHFYANILRKRGSNGKEFPIQALTGHRNHAPLEVQNCAKNAKELSLLFSNYPKLFSVTSNRGVILIESPLSNIENKIKNISLKSDDNNSKSSKAVEYYVDILRRWIPDSEFPISNLMVYLNRAPVDVRKEARNEEELIKFLLKHSDTFTVVQNKFVKLVHKSNNSIVQNNKLAPWEYNRNVNVDKGTRQFCYFPSLEFPKNPEFSGSWEDNVLKNIFLITEEDECLDACEVIKKEKIIALDCEGFNLGRGIISLIQIALINGKVYIFDIYELPSMISLGLKEIIESENILKVINHCRNDCINLKVQYNVNMKYIFDVAVAYHVIEYKMMSLSNFKPAGFNQMCAKYGVPTNTCKDDLKLIYLTQPDYWLTRPLKMKMISYAAFDVASLVPYLYSEFLKRMDEETEYAIWRLSQRMCIA